MRIRFVTSDDSKCRTFGTLIPVNRADMTLIMRRYPMAWVEL